jgi:serine O-acetyltransferase
MLAVENRINSKKDLKKWISYEINRYNRGIIKRYLSILNLTENDILVHHQILLRKTEYYTNILNKFLALLYKIRLNRIQNKYAIHIPINTCGKGLKIMHVGPVLMNGRVTVGKDCCFHINTALVAGGSNDGVPVLDDGVVVGIGAVVLGGYI